MEFVIWYNRSEEDERGTGERSVIRSERKQDYEAGDDDGKFLSKKVSLESVQNDRRFCGSWNAGIWDIRTNRQQKAPGGRTLTH